MQGFQMPSNVSKAFGKLDITYAIDSSPSAYRASFILQKYPYGCSNKSFAHIRDCRFKDVLSAFKQTIVFHQLSTLQIGWRAPEAIVQTTAHDGGMPFWRRGDATWPYITIHAAEIWPELRSKVLPFQRYTPKFKTYLKNIDTKYPHYYSQHP